MAELRIPRLAFSWKARLMQLVILTSIDIALFKPYDVSDIYVYTQDNPPTLLYEVHAAMGMVSK